MPGPPLHPWHGIPAGPAPPAVLTGVIEIPRYSRNKYELDKDLGLYRLDRVLHSAVHFPGDYGFIPRTLAEDDDPLDLLVLMTVPTFPGCLVEVRPLALFELIDRGVRDEKIIAVATTDPYSAQWSDLPELPPHALKEIEHFFLVYKDLEGLRTESRGFHPVDAAQKRIEDAMRRYRTRFEASPISGG